MSKTIKVCLLLAILAVTANMQAQKQVTFQNNEYMKHVLMVVSSHEDLGNTGKKTGFYLSEATHAYEVFLEAGYEIEIVSPKGGKAPVDGKDLEDPVNKKFWEDETFQHKIQNTLSPSQIDPSRYDVIYYAGGHGTMWDFPNNKELARIASSIYENKGIVAAVCHGPASLINIKLSDGTFLVDGKKVSTFTNEEEAEVKLEDVVPFLLESKLKERGARIEKAAPWQEQVSVDRRLVTGQNPASAAKVAREIVKLLK